MCAELYPAPIPLPPLLLWGQCRESKSQFEPVTKEGVGGRCFDILFYFPLSYCDLIGNKLNLFSLNQVWFAHYCN